MKAIKKQMAALEKYIHVNLQKILKKIHQNVLSQLKKLYSLSECTISEFDMNSENSCHENGILQPFLTLRSI